MLWIQSMFEDDATKKVLVSFLDFSQFRAQDKNDPFSSSFTSLLCHQ